MEPTVTLLLPFLLAILLCLPQVRACLLAIAQRRFYDRYLSRPRHRVYNPRSDDSTDEP